MPPKNCLQNNSIDLMEFPRLVQKYFEKYLELLQGTGCKPCTQKVEKHLKWLQGARLVYGRFLKSSWGGVLINPVNKTKFFYTFKLAKKYENKLKIKNFKSNGGGGRGVSMNTHWIFKILNKIYNKVYFYFIGYLSNIHLTAEKKSLFSTVLILYNQ